MMRADTCFSQENRSWGLSFRSTASAHRAVACLHQGHMYLTAFRPDQDSVLLSLQCSHFICCSAHVHNTSATF